MKSVRSRIIACFILVIAVSVLLPLLYVRVELRREIEKDAMAEGLRQAEIIAYALHNMPVADSDGRTAFLAYLSGMVRGRGSRLTILDAAGAVVFDVSRSGILPQETDNHLNRPEIRAAVASGRGVSIRRSNTLGIDLLYVAVRLDDGGILRLAMPHKDLDNLIYDRLAGLVLVCLIAVALSILIAVLFSLRLRRDMSEMVEVVRSMAAGNYGRRLRRVPGREFFALADAVNSMAENIERQLQCVADRTGQLEAVLHTVPDGVLVLDAHGRIRSHNPAMEHLFPEFSGADGRMLPEVLALYNLSCAFHELMNNGDAGPQERVRTIELEQPMGRFLLARLARPAADLPKNSLYSLGAVLVVTDITRLVRLERIRRDFVANVSHELRTPLTAIQGYAETLSSLIGAESENLAEQRRFAGIIERQAARLSRLVEDLLTLTRLENVGAKPPAAVCRPAGTAADAAQLFAQAAEKAGVKIELDVPEELELAISCDHLFQVLENLLGNALRHSPRGGKIAVSARRTGGECRISVSDQGPGVTPAEQDRVFERFYKAGGQTGPSTGLGLAICKHVVEFYGGRINLVSPDGEFASTFSFTLKAL